MNIETIAYVMQEMVDAAVPAATPFVDDASRVQQKMVEIDVEHASDLLTVERMKKLFGPIAALLANNVTGRFPFKATEDEIAGLSIVENPFLPIPDDAHGASFMMNGLQVRAIMERPTQGHDARLRFDLLHA